MLECYKDGQPIFYRIAMNAINNSKLSHAYIFDSNGNSSVMNIVYDFVKEIICFDINDKDSINNICKRIDDGNYIDVKMIKPDGLWIKKNQLLDLQAEFNNKAIEGKRKVYIIKSAEKMNVQTANSILKFLEEPVDDIIAILVIDNFNLLLPTIVSRCQVIKLNKMVYSLNAVDNLSNILDSYEFFDSSVIDKNNFINIVIEIIKSIEFFGIDTIIYTKKLIHNNFKDRDYYIISMDLMILFYYDVIRYISKHSLIFFSDYSDFINTVAEKNDIIKLCQKIECLDDARNDIRYNLNINLLIDKLIIDMCGDNI